MPEDDLYRARDSLVSEKRFVGLLTTIKRLFVSTVYISQGFYWVISFNTLFISSIVRWGIRFAIDREEMA